MSLTHFLSIVRRLSKQTWLATIVISLLALIVYLPAINRVFVTDQLWYFAELNGQTSLSAGLHHYDYAVSRQLWRGDESLFRPLLFVWLAIANNIFTYHHVWWNVSNLVLHVLTGISLFRLLMTINPSPFALPTVLCFIVLKPLLELVLWNHLGGYMLAYIFFMIAFRAWIIRLRIPKQAEIPVMLNLTYVIFFTCATLTYEVMIPAGIVLGGIALSVEYRRGVKLAIMNRVVPLFFPVIVYGCVYIVHVLQVERFGYVYDRGSSSLFDMQNLTDAIHSVRIAMGRWMLEVVLPSALEFLQYPFVRMGKLFVISFTSWGTWLNIIAILPFIWLIINLFSKRHVLRMYPIITAVICIQFAYVALICVGRPLVQVLGITYYLYPFCLLLMILFYSVLNYKNIKPWSTVVASMAFVLLVLQHGVETGAVTRKCREVNAQSSSYLVGIQEFVDLHKKEPDFSFQIQSSPLELDPAIELRVGYPENPMAASSRRVTQIIFSRYYQEKTAKYVISSE